MVFNEGLIIKDGVIMEGNFDGLFLFKMVDILEINIYFDVFLGYDCFVIIGEVLVGFVGFVIVNVIY